MTRPYVIRLLGAIAITAWCLCAADAVLQVLDNNLDGSAIANVLMLLTVGFAATIPFLVAVGFAITERD